MIGGSISRYHTPQTGSGMTEDLIKVAGPLVVGALQRGVEGVRRGGKAREVFAEEATRLKRNLKRKAPAMSVRLVGNQAKREAVSSYKRMIHPLRRAKPDIFA